MNMFIVRKNKVYESEMGRKVRVRDVKEDKRNPKFSQITLVDVDNRNRSVKGSERTIYQDSVRRRYVEA